MNEHIALPSAPSDRSLVLLLALLLAGNRADSTLVLALLYIAL